MKRTLTLFALMGLGAMALSTSASWKTFQEKYNIQKESHIGTVACQNCHVGKHGGKLNAYGKDLAAVMKEAETKKLTPEFLSKIEKLDSTKSGETNIVKIKGDKSPGQ